MLGPCCDQLKSRRAFTFSFFIKQWNNEKLCRQVKVVFPRKEADLVMAAALLSGLRCNQAVTGVRRLIDCCA